MARGFNSNTILDKLEKTKKDRGYNPTTLSEDVLATTLPSAIKCCRCKYIKGQACYSEKRLLDLKVAIHKDRRHARPTVAIIPCTKCTGHQVTEMECHQCDTWYDLDKFSKAQRKTPDEATCWRCMEDRLNDEPYGSDDGEDDFNPGSYDYDEEDDDDEGGTNVGGTSMASTSGYGSSSGGALLSAPLSRMSLNSVPSSVQRNGPGSVASTSQASTAPTTGNNRNFAKVKAVRQKHVFEGAGRVRQFEANKDPHDGVEVQSSEEESE